jgi:hypothetical protein
MDSCQMIGGLGGTSYYLPAQITANTENSRVKYCKHPEYTLNTLQTPRMHAEYTSNTRRTHQKHEPPETDLNKPPIRGQGEAVRTREEEVG